MGLSVDNEKFNSKKRIVDCILELFVSISLIVGGSLLSLFEGASFTVILSLVLGVTGLLFVIIDICRKKKRG